MKKSNDKINNNIISIINDQIFAYVQNIIIIKLFLVWYNNNNYFV